MNHFCHHIGIFTQHPLELVAFYSQKLGFKIGGTKEIPAHLMEKIFGVSSPAVLTKLRFDQVTLEIFSLTSPSLNERAGNAAGYNHWGWAVRDKEAFVQKLKQNGVPVIEAGNKGRSIVFLADPDGNLIEIYEE